MANNPLWRGPVELRWRSTGGPSHLVDYLLLGDVVIGSILGLHGQPHGKVVGYRARLNLINRDKVSYHPTEAEARSALLDAAVRALGGSRHQPAEDEGR